MIAYLAWILGLFLIDTLLQHGWFRPPYLLLDYYVYFILGHSFSHDLPSVAFPLPFGSRTFSILTFVETIFCWFAHGSWTGPVLWTIIQHTKLWTLCVTLLLLVRYMQFYYELLQDPQHILPTPFSHHHPYLPVLCMYVYMTVASGGCKHTLPFIP